MIITGSAPEGTNWYLPARVTAPDGTVLYSDAGAFQVTALAVAVFDVDGDSPEVAVYSALLTVATYFDRTSGTGLVVDGYWGQDGVGRNFLGLITAANFEQHGTHSYRVEYTATTGYGVIPIDFLVNCTPRGSS